MFGSRKGYQARPPPPPKQRKPAAAPPPKKQLFAFDPVAAHYNALNHERRHGVTQPVVCVDLNAASERRRWRETADLSEAAATIKALVPEAANEGELLERALAAHLRRRATPSIRCWDLVKARLAFQRIDCCVYCGESTRTEDEAVPCRSFKRPGGCAAEAHRRCLARAGVGLLSTRWTCGVCVEVARRRSVRTPADQRAADAQEAEAAAAAALRASGTTPSTAPSWVAQLAQRGGQKSRRVAQQRRTVLCGPSKTTLRRWRGAREFFFPHRQGRGAQARRGGRARRVTGGPSDGGPGLSRNKITRRFSTPWDACSMGT